ncbi:MAG: glycoside hydrolase family 3 N-terminal domain-containing protein [Anaerolineaceae bacterium]
MEKKSFKFFLVLSILALLLSSTGSVLANSQNAQNTYTQKAQQLLDKMTPEEKVGQLFLITFQGDTLSEDSELFALMQDYQVGGVILSRADDNFSGPEGTVTNAYALITQLQQKNWENSLAGFINEEMEQSKKNYVPLFIGISQDGDSYPFDQILSGLSTLPNQMAIGATFSTELAKSSGELLGQELQAMGFNLFLGPSLDVLDASNSESDASLGTRTFGGDPYWVGELGKAFISGLHAGSNSKMVVIAKHFPGRGSSDRLPEEEVATVRKSLEQLKLIELAPFFATATINSNDATTTADGFLVSHIRYQGFQGNIRETTKPVSFDSSALSSIMSLEQFNTWRNAGGILVSDSLGGNAIRSFFDPNNEKFDGKQIALNAFLAGNDVLYLDNFQSTGDESEMESIRGTLDFFTQKYREDNAFAEKVDEAVLRILALKYKTYDLFSLLYVLPAEEQLGIIGQGYDVLSKIARGAATLVNPTSEELSSILPDPPTTSDRIVFITDIMDAAQCSTCDEEEILSTNALEDTVLRLYGENGTGQVIERRLRSYSFKDLNEYLDDSRNRADVGSYISEANWLVFSILDVEESRAGSDALKRLLAEKPDLLRDKKVIVFAFNVPFYLDATDLTFIDAYYCLYSKTSVFIETAARLLFQEIVPKGHSPVSIPVVGYDLIEMTYPDPNQTIALDIDVDNLSESKKIESEETGVENLVFRVGDALPVKAGPILDRNGLPVPDGTVVYFMIDHLGENEQSTILEAQTIGGIASMSYPLQSYGRVEIRAQSDPAKNSDIFVLDITSEAGSVISQITPTPLPTQVSPSVVANQGNVDDETATSENEIEKSLPGTMQWFLASLVILGIAYGIYLLTQRFFSLTGGTVIALYAVIAGYGCFLWFQLNMPGSFPRTDLLHLLYLILWVILFTCIGAGIGAGKQMKLLKKPAETSSKKADQKTDKKQSGGNPE